MRWASKGSWVRLRSALIVFGPNVRFGTKWPSMTSRWIRSAPAFSTRRTALTRFDRSASRMLAATRARPAAIRRPCSSCAGRGDGLALAAKGRRALRDQPLAPPRDDGRGRLALVLGRELAACGADLLAAVAADRHGDPFGPQPSREPLDGRHRAGDPRRVRDRVHRDEVDVGEVAGEERREGGGVGVRVVHPADERDLVADPAARRTRVIARRLDDLGDRPPAVQWHEDVTEGVAGRVEAHRERELRTERREPADARDDARRAHRDVAGTEAEPSRIRESGDRLEDAVEVEERLALAHEHDVRQAAAVRREVARGPADL